MRTTRLPGFATVGLAAFLAGFLLIKIFAQQPAIQAVHVDSDDLGGVVTSVKGPEAGVWVIAETTDLPTKFAKIVVTDDVGRYVLPDLPTSQLHAYGCGVTDWWIHRRFRPARQEF